MFFITRPCGLDGITTPLGSYYLKSHGTFMKAKKTKAGKSKSFMYYNS